MRQLWKFGLISILVLSWFANNSYVYAEEELKIGETYRAKLLRCVDGDTANFEIKGKLYKTRFLYIDTPESTRQQEPYGKESSTFTCEFLKQGEITVETDGIYLYDKYDRLLAWVFVDGILHQEVITAAGLVEDFYDFGTYKYEDRVLSAMESARNNKVGMYSEYTVEEIENGYIKEDNASMSDSNLNNMDSSPTKKDSNFNEVDGNTNNTTLDNSSSTTEAVTQENSESASEQLDTTTDAWGVVGLLNVIAFYFIPKILKRKSMKTLIHHRLIYKGIFRNALMFIVLWVLWFFVFVINVIELIRFAKAK